VTSVVITDLVLVHGFWSSSATWDPLAARIQHEPELSRLDVHRFGYPSPKLRLPGLPSRIPDYDDIAQTLPGFLETHISDTATVALVTHSQGGLILQRFLFWMLSEGRGRDLASIRLIVMLACPNEGSEYLSSIRAVAGFGRHPQAKALHVLNTDVSEARRIVLRQIINADRIDERHCQIPFYVYSGDSDNVVRRASAQSTFPNVGVLPGDHFSILDPEAPGSLTFNVLKRHLLASIGLPSASRNVASAHTSAGHLPAVIKGNSAPVQAPESMGVAERAGDDDKQSSAEIAATNENPSPEGSELTSRGIEGLETTNASAVERPADSGIEARPDAVSSKRRELNSWQPTGQWIQQFREALDGGFDEASMELLTTDLFSPERAFSKISPPGFGKTYQVRLQELINQARMNDWLIDLVAAAQERRPQNVAIARIAEDLGVPVTGPRIDNRTGETLEELRQTHRRQGRPVSGLRSAAPTGRGNSHTT
jgi:pimeloyl-ACP methyl ester carboxylesterase